jgi:hypothetical protein
VRGFLHPHIAGTAPCRYRGGPWRRARPWANSRSFPIRRV